MKVFVCSVVLFSLLAFAQDTPPVEEQDPPTTTEESEPVQEQDEGLESEEVQPGEFVYRPQGRRDPFWDLSLGERMKGKREAKEGIAGLMIDELTLEGIVKSDGAYRALLSGPDNEPYDVSIGQNVYDGVIVKIDTYSVVFKKFLTVALGGKRERLITKWLNPEEEGRR